MKTIAFAAILLSASAAPSFAVHPATQQDHDEIQDILTDLPTLDNVSRPIAANKVIWLTLRAYGIVTFSDDLPLLEFRKSLMPSPEKTSNADIQWIPVYDESKTIPKQGEDGRIINPNSKVESDVCGNTASDGIARIFPNCLLDRRMMNPPILASILLHEQRHFEHMTNAAIRRNLSPAEQEEDSYNLEKKYLDNNTLGYSPAEADVQRNRLAKIRIDLDARLAEARGHENSYKSHSPAELRAVKIEAFRAGAKAFGEHDGNLSAKINSAAYSACHPGLSLSQEYLDRLTQAYDRKRLMPKGLETDCANAVFKYLADGGRSLLEVHAIVERILGARRPSPIMIRPTLPPPPPRGPVTPIAKQPGVPKLPPPATPPNGNSNGTTSPPQGQEEPGCFIDPNTGIRACPR